jgi:hypothetical protein
MNALDERALSGPSVLLAAGCIAVADDNGEGPLLFLDAARVLWLFYFL